MADNPFDPNSPLVQELVKRAAAQQSQTPTATSSAPHPSMAGPMLADAGGDIADILSTNWGLRHGGHEVNPLLSSNPTANAVEQAGTDAAIQLLIHKLGPNHPVLAKILGYGHGAWGFGGLGMTLANTSSGVTPQGGIRPEPGNTYNGAITPGAPEINLK